MADLSEGGNLLYICFQAIYFTSLACFFAVMLQPRWKKIPTAVLYVVGNLLLGILITVRIPRTVCLTAFHFLYPLLMYKDKFAKRLVVLIAAYVWLYSADIFSYATINVFLIENADLKMILACSLCAIVIACCLTLTGHFIRVVKTVKLSRRMIAISTIPLSQFFLFMIFDMRFIGVNDGALWTTPMAMRLCILTIIAIGFCFVADILAFRAFTDVVQNVELKAAVDALEYKNQLNVQYYSDLKQNETELRKIKHDFSNIMQVMETLLHTTDSPEARRLYETLSRDIGSIPLAYYSENSFVNAVISNKVKLCEAQGIACDVNVLVPSSLPIDEMDLCRALVNLIDNAIEASARDETAAKKAVSIEVFERDGYIFIKTKNNASGLSWETKKDDAQHGLGQKILSELAQKYAGEYLIRQEGTDVIALFTMRTELPNAE